MVEASSIDSDASVYRHMFLYQGKNVKDEQIYAYVAVDANKAQAFAEALRHKKEFHLQDYGTIVESGQGIPSDEVKKRIGKKYFFDPEDAAVFLIPQDKDTNNG